MIKNQNEKNQADVRPEVEAAMAEALEDAGTGISSPTGAAPGEGTVQVIVRVPAATRDRWKDAAEKSGVSMSEFIRVATDEKAVPILDCSHRSRRVYPWAQFCNDCGARLLA
jgi:hypothetical protein